MSCGKLLWIMEGTSGPWENCSSRHRVSQGLASVSGQPDLEPHDPTEM